MIHFEYRIKCEIIQNDFIVAPVKRSSMIILLWIKILTQWYAQGIVNGRLLKFKKIYFHGTLPTSPMAYPRLTIQLLLRNLVWPLSDKWNTKTKMWLTLSTCSTRLDFTLPPYQKVSPLTPSWFSAFKLSSPAVPIQAVLDSFSQDASYAFFTMCAIAL